jgi:hypothetical protein
MDPQAGRRPARFHVGPNTRAVSVPTPVEDSGPTGGAAKSASSSSADPVEQQLSANSIALQFTMATAYPLYTGIEAETGRLSLPGSNLAAAYAVVGLEQRLGFGAVGAELAAGWQGVRYNSGDEDHDTLVAEPRLRGQVWIAEQWTLGATFGARIAGGQKDDWMGGAYLGVHSHRF